MCLLQIRLDTYQISLSLSLSLSQSHFHCRTICQVSITIVFNKIVTSESVKIVAAIDNEMENVDWSLAAGRSRKSCR